MAGKGNWFANSTPGAKPSRRGPRVRCSTGLDEHRPFRSSGNLVVSNLDRITHVNNVGNERPCDTLYLLAPVTISEDRCERCHLGSTLGSVEPLVLDEI